MDYEGCQCRGCGVRYKVDFNIPDDMWVKIGMQPVGGLLCGPCVTYRIEALGEFDAYELVRL